MGCPNLRIRECAFSEILSSFFPYQAAANHRLAQAVYFPWYLGAIKKQLSVIFYRSRWYSGFRTTLEEQFQGLEFVSLSLLAVVRSQLMKLQAT